MEGARVTSVISNRCIRTRLLVFLKISNVRVGVEQYYLQIFVGMLVSRISGGSGGWASVPLWCIILLAEVVGFTLLSSLLGCSSYWCFVRFPAAPRNFALLQNVQTESAAHPACPSRDTFGSSQS